MKDGRYILYSHIMQVSARSKTVGAYLEDVKSVISYARFASEIALAANAANAA